jgi:anti-sigma factor RsiW
MNCSQMRMLLSPFANDELSEEERQMVELHLAGCAACRRALEEIADLRGRLSLLHAITLDTEIADGIISKIRQMTDTQSPETLPDTTDVLSPPGDKGLTDKNDDPARGTVVDLPLDSTRNLLPDWRTQGEA